MKAESAYFAIVTNIPVAFLELLFCFEYVCKKCHFESDFEISKQNKNSKKLQKKLYFLQQQSTHSELSLEKINVIAILDHFLAP